MTANKPANRLPGWVSLAAILVIALALRLTWVLVVDPKPSFQGGDGPYYLETGRSLAGQGNLSWSSMLAIGPVYPLYLSIFYRLLHGNEAVIRAARLGQVLLDCLTCWLAFDLGRRVWDNRVGLLTAALLAIDLRFIQQVGEISTETLFIFLLMVSSWAFVLAREHASESGRPWGLWAVVGAVLGLMTAFTRAIALPLPFLLTGSLLLPKPSRTQLLAAGVIGGLAILGVVGWSIRQYQVTGQWVIISDGLTGNFWMGSRMDGQWHGNAEFQDEINDLKARYNGRLAYVEDAMATIRADPLAYGRLLVTKTASAYLQPYGTTAFHGEGLKELAVQTLQGQLTLGELVGSDAFWPKLYIYIFHFVSLIGGLVGLWLTRRQWLRVLPISLPIFYLSAAYILLTIIPRYVFPVMPFLMLLAAYTLVRVIDAWPKPQKTQSQAAH